MLASAAAAAQSTTFNGPNASLKLNLPPAAIAAVELEWSVLRNRENVLLSAKSASAQELVDSHDLFKIAQKKIVLLRNLCYKTDVSGALCRADFCRAGLASFHFCNGVYKPLRTLPRRNKSLSSTRKPRP